MTNFDNMMNNMCCNFDDRIEDMCCNFDDTMDDMCCRHSDMDDDCPNHDNCNRSNFRTTIRTEFLIKASPQTICNVLQELCGQEVRIDGYSIQSICDGCSVFRFVVGDSDCQSITDIQLARSILCDLSIQYLEDAIIKVTSRDRSSLELAKLYCALQRKSHVNASYPARTCGLYFQADPIEDALNALKGGICQ